MFENGLVKYFTKHKKNLFCILVCIGLFYLSTQGVFATETGIDGEQGSKIIKALNGFLAVIGAVLALITSLISIFLYPGWVNGTYFGLQDYLKDIWILVSNVVYFIFAFILIAIAFMNIIGKGTDRWELKQALPKFVVGVLIVPFSWFMIQFILSVSSILTVGVLTLPYDAFNEKEIFKNVLENSERAEEKFCNDIVIALNGDFGSYGGNTQNISSAMGDNDPISQVIRCKDENSMVSMKEFLQGRVGEEGGQAYNNSIYGILSIYTYGILRLQDLDEIRATDLSTIRGLIQLISKVLFDIVFVVVYLILMVALFLALLVRGIRLWVFMMLSPMFGLLYFFGKSSGGDGILKKFNIKEFIALAMVPVLVAAALAFGLVFTLVAAEGIKKESQQTDLDTIDMGGVSVSIIGAHGGADSNERSVIGQLIVELFGVVILWIAVIAALNTSAVVRDAIEPITAFGKSMGELAAKSPGYMPIIPAGKGEDGKTQMMGAAGLQNLGATLEAAPRQANLEKSSKFVDNWINPSDSTQVQRAINNLTDIEKQNGQGFKKAIDAMNENGILFQPGQQRNDAINLINENLGLDINLGQKVGPTQIAQEFRRAISDKGYNAETSALMFGSGGLNQYLSQASDNQRDDNSQQSEDNRSEQPINLNIGNIQEDTYFEGNGSNISNTADIQGLASRIGTTNIQNTSRDQIVGALRTQVDRDQRAEKLADALIDFVNNNPNNQNT